MQDAINLSADGKHTPITAGPDAPTTATCPDCGGTVTLRKRTRMDGTTHQLDLSSFRSGVYFLTIRSRGFVTTRKMIKL